MSVLTKRRRAEAVAARRSCGCPTFPPTLLSFFSLLGPVVLWVTLPISLYFFYRAVACTANHWECRVKSARQTFEDVWALIALSSIIFFLGGMYPRIVPARSEWASKSSGGSGEDLLSPRPIPAQSRWQHTLATRTKHFSSALSVVGFASALIAMFVLGSLGNIGAYSYSLTAGNLFQPPAVYVVAPGLALCALAILISLYFSYSVGGVKDMVIFFSVAVAVLTYHLVSLSIASSGPGPGTGCAKLLFHPHHYALAFMALLLMRSNGFTVPSSPSFFILSSFVYITKCAVCGLFVQGMAQYGVDSILRSTSCATS